VNRLFPALSLSLLVSLGLFWLMQFMIMNNQQGFKKTDNLKMVEFVRLKRETQLQTKDRKIPDKPPPKKQPPPPSMQVAQTSIAQQKIPELAMPNLDLPIQTSRFSGPVVGGLQMGKGKISTNLIPLVRIPPRYPMRAQSRRIEGWVKIEFTITTTGTVKNAKVVESQPSSVFDRAALKAIARWKFKPKIIDGDAFEQRALQVLQFNLSK
jgi:protein TonB